MGAFLFYLVKSGFCLVLFYLFFKLLMSGTTFFRLNRFCVLVGMVCCLLLPLVELTTEKQFLYAPLQSLRFLLEELPDSQPVQWANVQTFSEVEYFRSSDGLGHSTFFPLLAGSVYLVGAGSVLLWICLSTYRMWQFIREAEKKKLGDATLIITRRAVCSFSWGRYIVLSEADYQQHADEILRHEMMHLRHRHTLDLIFVQLFLVLHWFNPAAWLLKRELQNIHEYEADNGVINTGIDATRYQLLLVKKAVGTRLYSMANGFNHSKLKNRITMMLKERTNRWARLKLLLFVPVVAGTLYAFAQPEVKDVLQQVKPEVQQETTNDYSSLMSFFQKERERWEAYKRQTGGETLVYKIKEKQVHPLFINANNKMLFDGVYFETLDGLKPAIIRNLLKSWEASGKKEAQVIYLQYDRGSDINELTEMLRLAKSAFEQIQTDLSATLPDKSKESVDKLFPILLAEGDPKNYGNKLLVNEKVISQIVVTLPTSEGVETIENFTLSELEKKVMAARSKSADKENFVVGLKVDKNCQMGLMTDVKQVLRKAFVLKVNQTSM